MSSQTPHDMIRAYCDGELTPAETTDFEARISAESILADQVAFERAFRDRVGRAMRAEAPAGLAERVRAALATDGAAAEMREPVELPVEQSVEASAAVPTAVRGMSIFTGPTRANVFAVAATLAVVAGAVMFGIFGRPIDSVAPAVSPVTDIAKFVSTEHGRCAGDLADRDRKAAWLRPTAADRLRSHLGMSVPILDLDAVGFRFVGAGACMVPGEPVSAHLIYARSEPGRDGCPQAMLSLFVVPNHGQFDGAGALNGDGWNWAKIGDRPECRRRVACAGDGNVIYFLVCCNEAELPDLAAEIGNAARRADRGKKP